MITRKLVTTHISNFVESISQISECPTTTETKQKDASGLNNRKGKREDIKVVRLRIYEKCHG